MHISNKSALNELKYVFSTKGTRCAIAYLNSLTDHRFTSLYRFDGDTLRSVIFYDRQHPEMLTCEDIPVMASYCVFVRDSGAMFTTHEATRDVRLANHPKQHIVQAYCGVPLLDQNGKMFGTICHFDFQPRSTADVDVELLEYMAHLLQNEITCHEPFQETRK